ncbi:hypothetical protein [Polycladomyces zharkentensis]|nr:hypothetical protein [Polycladomyces sp. WAk]
MPNIKPNLVNFLKQLGYTDKDLRQLTDDQLAAVAFEEACELMKP